jgi:hypothetical protein
MYIGFNELLGVSNKEGIMTTDVLHADSQPTASLVRL